MAFHLKIQTFLFNLRARCRCWQIADPFHNNSLCKKLRRLPLLQLWQARPNLHHSQQIARPAAEKTMGGKAKSQAAATCTWGDHMGMCTVGCLACFKGICTWSACTSLFFWLHRMQSTETVAVEQPIQDFICANAKKLPTSKITKEPCNGSVGPMLRASWATSTLLP